MLSCEGRAEMQAFRRAPGPVPLSPVHAGPKGSGGGGHTRSTRVRVCGVSHVPLSVPALPCHLFLINQGRREGEFGQRNKLCGETVWDAGNKKASKNASHQQPLASLRRHSYKPPAPPAPANSSARPACRRLPSAARCVKLPQGVTGPWRLPPGPKPESDSLPPPGHQGRKAPAETGGGSGCNDLSPLQGFQDNSMEMVTLNSPVIRLPVPHPLSHCQHLPHSRPLPGPGLSFPSLLSGRPTPPPSFALPQQ